MESEGELLCLSIYGMFMPNFSLIMKDLHQFIQSFPFAFRFECIEMICLFTFQRTCSVDGWPNRTKNAAFSTRGFQISLWLS